MRLEPLRPRDRAPLEQLLQATDAFSAAEIAVALQLFDMSVVDEESGSLGSSALAGRQAPVVPSDAKDPHLMHDYEFVGAFGTDERLAGYACFGPTPATDGTWDLYWLAVDRAAQGSGIGRALVRWVEGELAARGARLLVVETSSRADYARTRRFYARSGYAEAARLRDFYAPADDRIILTTRLPRDRGVATQ